MSDPYREPRPISPERLALLSIDSVKHEDYMVEMQATFLFDPYTPDWPGELSRAVSTLTKVISDAAVNAERKRERKGATQYEGMGVPPVLGECECGCQSSSESDLNLPVVK